MLDYLAFHYQHITEGCIVKEFPSVLHSEVPLRAFMFTPNR